MVIDKPQKVEIQKIDSMVVLIWPGDLMLSLWTEIDPDIDLNVQSCAVSKYIRYRTKNLK